MHHGTDIRTSENIVKAFDIANIAMHPLRRPARELSDPVQRYIATIAEVIQHQNIVAGLNQGDAGVTANVARAPGHQYGF